MPRRIIRTLKAFSACALALTLSGCIGTWGIAPQSKTLQANTLTTDAAIREAATDA
ncbi:MAG TPA: RND transporter, partial [Pseudomonas sp.]|nr:RND transporter [Pseudomonas sp.]